jgi:hypothetical protein
LSPLIIYFRWRYATGLELHWQLFFLYIYSDTTNKDLFYIVPGYRSTIKLRHLKPEAGTTISVLGNSKTLPCKQTGYDCIIDLSRLKPGDISTDVFAIKLKNAY